MKAWMVAPFISYEGYSMGSAFVFDSKEAAERYAETNITGESGQHVLGFEVFRGGKRPPRPRFVCYRSHIDGKAGVEHVGWEGDKDGSPHSTYVVADGYLAAIEAAEKALPMVDDIEPHWEKHDSPAQEMWVSKMREMGLE